MKNIDSSYSYVQTGEPLPPFPPRYLQKQVLQVHNHSMPYRVLIETEFLPLSLNKKIRRGGFASSNENKKWAWLINHLAGHLKPKRPLDSCKITIIRHFHRQLDFDGLVGSMKPVVDALRKNGFIADDTYKVTGQWDVRQEFRPRSEGALLQIWVEQKESDKALEILSRFDKG